MCLNTNIKGKEIETQKLAKHKKLSDRTINIKIA